MNKIIVGLTEKVTVIGKDEKTVIARIDTGANYNSIATKLASKLELGPIVKTIKIKTSNGVEVRPVVKAKIKLKGKTLYALFNVTDRSSLKYNVLIGQEVLKRGFLIDPSKKCD